MKSQELPEWSSRLMQARLKREWSQQDVATQLGIIPLTVSRWERGVVKPRRYYRTLLCDLFHMSAEELGFTSQPQATASISSIEAADHAVPLFDPAIPLPVTLVGREGLLSCLKTRLCAEGMTIIGIYGIPGAGKSTLANVLAHDGDVHECFPDGVLWVGLGPEPNCLELLKRWATLLLPGHSTKKENVESLGKLLHSTIGTRSFLVVVDDAWLLEDALAFKIGGPNCSYVLTTRFPEIAARIGDGENIIQLSDLNGRESLALLALLAPRAVELDQQHLLEELIHEVGGLPLALTLIGNYLRVVAASGQPRRLQTAITQLHDADKRLKMSEPRSPLERHTSLPSDIPLSLGAVIAVSDQMLDHEVRRVLYDLSVFPAKPNTFSEDAALFVADCTTEVLDRLVDAGLLEGNSPGRYHFHPSIADYAAQQRGENTPAGQRMAVYYVAYLQKRDHETKRKIPAAESRNIQAALSLLPANPQQERLQHVVDMFEHQSQAPLPC